MGDVLTLAACHPGGDWLLFCLADRFECVVDLGRAGPAGSPLHRSLLRAADDPRWRRFTAGCASRLVYHEPSFYHGLLCGHTDRIEVWETTYHHELADHLALVEWYKGTGMRPCLERLPDEPSRRAFEDDVLEGCRADYPVQPNGRVLYPFRRLFFVACAR